MFSIFLLFMLIVFPMASATIFDYTVSDAEGREISMSLFKGQKAYLIVNVASFCGFTANNYAELQQLHEKYSSAGLEIIAFPCNDFGQQEPKSNIEIVNFARSRGATFTVLGKLDMKHPLYKYLTSVGSPVTWNFGKFLMDASGIPVAQYQPNQSPLAMEQLIIKTLSQPSASASASVTPQTPSSLKIELTIIGQRVEFEVQPTEESVLSVSRNFCIRNQEALGIAPLTEASLPNCQQPIVDALVEAIRKDATEKEKAADENEKKQQQQQQQVVEVELRIGNKDYVIRLRPAVDSVAQVVRNFCIDNAVSLGYSEMTEANLPSCQEPVSQYLYSQLQTIVNK